MSSWINKLNADPTDWLLESEPWTKYKTYTDLLNLEATHADVVAAKQALINNEKIISLANETKDWLSVSATRNSDPKITYFKLKALAEFGLKSTDLTLDETVKKASEHIVGGMFGVRGQTPERPKRGEKYVKPDLAADVWHVSPCNSPIITSALLELGVQNELVDQAVNTLKDKWQTPQGWFCHFFFVNSQFKKLNVGCPVAGLQALEVFSKIPELKESVHAKFAYEPLQFHKTYGKTLYYFGRSKKFWTLKYPFVWYNALYLADVLTRFDGFKQEPLVMELVNWIMDMQDENGRFKPTSVFMNYKGWDFANKKEASSWMTFLCCRVLKQYYS